MHLQEFLPHKAASGKPPPFFFQLLPVRSNRLPSVPRLTHLLVISKGIWCLLRLGAKSQRLPRFPPDFTGTSIGRSLLGENDINWGYRSLIFRIQHFIDINPERKGSLPQVWEESPVSSAPFQVPAHFVVLQPERPQNSDYQKDSASPVWWSSQAVKEPKKKILQLKESWPCISLQIRPAFSCRICSCLDRRCCDEFVASRSFWSCLETKPKA